MTVTETDTLVIAPIPRRQRGELASDRVSVGLSTRVGTLFVLAVAAIYFLIPVWWLLVSATKSTGELFSTNGFWFGDEWNLWTNIVNVFSRDDGVFPLWLLNSLVYAGVGGVGATLFGAACGYALAKLDFPGKSVVFATIIAGVLLPAALLTVPLFLLFSALDIVNTYWSVLIPAFVSPFAVYLSRIYADASIPKEVIEAARVDGAGELRIFATIGLRIMSPALVTVFLFSFVSIWNNFFLPLVMLKDISLFPATLGIFNWFNIDNQTPYSDVITASALSVIPLVIAFVCLQRFWRAGLTAGAVKA